MLQNLAVNSYSVKNWNAFSENTERDVVMKTKDFFNWARFRVGKQTILVKTFGTLCLSCIENLIQVKPPLASHAGVFSGARVSSPR